MKQKFLGILDAIDCPNSNLLKQILSGLIWSLLLGSFAACAAYFAYIFQ